MVVGKNHKTLDLSEIKIEPLNINHAESVSRLIIDNLLKENIKDYGQGAISQIILFYTPEWINKFMQTQNIFGAFYESELIGTITLDNETVRNLFVHTDFHHSGIGGLLIRFIEDYAVQKKVQNLILMTNLSAVKFYKKLGYQSTGRKAEKMGDSEIRFIIMKKPLTNPSKTA